MPSNGWRQPDSLQARLDHLPVPEYDPANREESIARIQETRRARQDILDQCPPFPSYGCMLHRARILADKKFREQVDSFDSRTCSLENYTSHMEAYDEAHRLMDKGIAATAGVGLAIFHRLRVSDEEQVYDEAAAAGNLAADVLADD